MSAASNRIGRPLRRLSRTLGMPALLGVLALVSVGARAAEIYVLDAVIEGDGQESASPTFIVTPGERALMSFEGEDELEVAMTVTPRESDAGTFDLRVEMIDGVETSNTVVPVGLSETETLELGGRTIRVLVRVQEPIGDAPPADAPAADGAGTGASGTGASGMGASGTGASGTGTSGTGASGAATPGAATSGADTGSATSGADVPAGGAPDVGTPSSAAPADGG